MGHADNIMAGQSYYLVEALSVLRVLEAIDHQDNIITLALFDELYRGTNSDERIQAGYNVLRYTARNAIVIAATQDLELTEMLKQEYSNYHFSEKVGTNGLEFDYTIKVGASQTRNAIALLKYLGYPDEIVSQELPK